MCKIFCRPSPQRRGGALCSEVKKKVVEQSLQTKGWVRAWPEGEGSVGREGTSLG